MAVRPLRPAIDRRFGGPLPRQLANQTRIHPVPINLLPQEDALPWSHAVLPAVSSCYPPVQCRFSTRYSPVRHYVMKSVRKLQSLHRSTCMPKTSIITPFDLHVLGTPPAFILSQDRTLMLKNRFACKSISSSCFAETASFHF